MKCKECNQEIKEAEEWEFLWDDEWVQRNLTEKDLKRIERWVVACDKKYLYFVEKFDGKPQWLWRKKR